MAYILIIDDEVEARVTLREILESAGYEVVEASDGLEGIRLYREKPAELIVTDIIMPYKEGLETIRELTAEFPKAKIIAISRGGRLEPEPYLKMAERLGANRIFTKPIEREKLLEAVRELLS
jgi:CheY-like chemotaxis protein